MWKKLSGSFALAIENIRSHFFHTVLSVLGMIIGVAALVAILSMIDGMEKFARDQIKNTTSLNAISVTSPTVKWINNVRVKKDSLYVITYDQLPSLKSALTRNARMIISTEHATELTIRTFSKSIGAMVWYVNESPRQGELPSHGRMLSEADVVGRANVAFINPAFVKLIGKTSSEMLNKFVFFDRDSFRIIGIKKDTVYRQPVVEIPISTLPLTFFQTAPPRLIIDTNNFEDVKPVKDDINTWLKNNFGEHADEFEVSTNEYRLAQAAKGFLLFRIIMGMIVGISIVVGGIGIMNVLLISVTQRTVEIGVRKAVGANKNDIVMQFLCESITISVFGSVMGLIFGILFTMATIPIVNMMIELPFQAIFTWTTIAIIAIIAIVIGIVFGTYPAIKASRLDPVEAIRKE